LPPSQNVVVLPGVIVGVGGTGFTVTAVDAEGVLLQPPVVTMVV